MISADLLLKCYEAALIRRWSDFVCPVPLDELSRQGHVLATALLLARCEARRGRPLDESLLVELAFVRFFRRLALSDISSPVYNRLYQGEHRALIDGYCFEVMEPFVAGLGDGFESHFRAYLTEADGQLRYESVAPVLGAASDLVTWWEFGLIEPFNASHHQLQRVHQQVNTAVGQHSEIAGVDELIADPAWLQVYGQLRTQRRWTRIATMPEFMVAGHCFVVAMLAFAWSLAHNVGPTRLAENVFGGVVHDLAEALTRDVSSPVKYGAAIDDVLAEIERDMLTESLFPHMPCGTATDLSLLVFDEFADKERDGERIYDGNAINVCDKLAATSEAAVSISNGLASPELFEAAEYYANDWGVGSGRALGASALFDDLWERMRPQAGQTQGGLR